MSIRTTGRHRRRSRGFTLMEMVTSCLVISLIMVSLGYALKLALVSTGNGAAQAAATLDAGDVVGRITDDLNEAINFGSPANGYTMPGLAAPDGRAGDYTVKLTDEPYKVSLGTAAFGASSVTSVQFTRYGYPTAAGSVVVTSGGYSKTIYLDGTTGRTEVR